MVFSLLNRTRERDGGKRDAVDARRGYGWLFLALVLAVAALTLGPSPPRSVMGYSLDAAQLLGHCAAFFLLSLVGMAVCESAPRLVAALAGFAAALELGQFLVPGRSPDFADFAAGLAGITLAWAIGRGWCRLGLGRLVSIKRLRR